MHLIEAKLNVDLLTKYAFMSIIKASTHPMVYVSFPGIIGTLVGTVDQRVFLFSDYLGGEEEAVYWATQWRNETYLQLLMANTVSPIPCATPAAFTKVREINKSGKCGLQLIDYIQHKKKNGQIISSCHVYQWAATYIEFTQEGNKIKRTPKMKRYNIKKLGFNEAKQLASDYRDDMVEQINSPEWQRLRELWRLDKSIRA